MDHVIITGVLDLFLELDIVLQTERQDRTGRKESWWLMGLSFGRGSGNIQVVIWTRSRQERRVDGLVDGKAIFRMIGGIFWVSVCC